MIRRFSQKVGSEGIIRSMREREAFVTNTEKRRTAEKNKRIKIAKEKQHSRRWN
jgi:ribosomal protein S21